MKQGGWEIPEAGSETWGEMVLFMLQTLHLWPMSSKGSASLRQVYREIEFGDLHQQIVKGHTLHLPHEKGHKAFEGRKPLGDYRC